MNPDETFIDDVWILRSKQNPIYDLDMNISPSGRSPHPSDITVDQSILTDLPNGFVKLQTRAIVPLTHLKEIKQYMFLNSYRPYHCYYKNINDEKLLPRLIDIARAIIYTQHNLKLERYYINSNNKTVSFSYEDGEDVYLNMDSLFLDDFLPYRLVLDYDVKYIEEVFNDYPVLKSQITWIRDVPIVSVSFEPLDILNEVTIIVNGYRENNYVVLNPAVERIAKLFNLESSPSNEDDNVNNTISDSLNPHHMRTHMIHQLLHMDQHDVNKLLYDAIPRVNTRRGYGGDLLMIRYYASVVYEEVFNESNMFDDILVLSDGSLRVPVSDEVELQTFEEALAIMLEEHEEHEENIIYSISDQLDVLIAIKLLHKHGYIGLIGDAWYLIDTQPIPKYTMKQIVTKTKSIQKWYKKHCKNLIGNEPLSKLARMEILGTICFEKDSYNTSMFNIDIQ